MLPFSKKIWNVWLSCLVAGYWVFAVLLWQLPDGRFHVYFLDIGQGDGILVKTPDNHQILIDGGPKNYILEELSEVLPFFDKTIDLVVLTHPHADHIDGLVEVLKRYKVENVLITGIDYDSPNYTEFLKEIRNGEVKVFVATKNLDFQFGEVVFDILYPEKQILGKKIDNLNNSSIVMKVLHHDKTLLLTGDMELEEEALLMESGADLKADILKAGHHGSRTSTSGKLLTLVKPKIAVIQCGRNNSFGHPHVETIENLKLAKIKNVYRNDRDGRVEISF